MHISILPQASEKRKEKKKKKENKNKKTTRASIWKEESQNTKSWNWNKTQQCSDFLQTCLSQLLNKIYSYFTRKWRRRGKKEQKFTYFGLHTLVWTRLLKTIVLTFSVWGFLKRKTKNKAANIIRIPTQNRFHKTHSTQGRVNSNQMGVYSVTSVKGRTEVFRNANSHSRSISNSR